jgi:hypothetical protein
VSDDASSAARSRRCFAGSVLVLVVLCLASYGRFLSIGLVGHDSYPVIAASRVHSFGALAGTFTEELMDGRFEQHYYRPVLNLTVALDEWISGLDPRGYQLSNLLWFIAAVLALHALVYRLSGEDRLAALLAAVAFLLHVVHGVVVPVVSRRPETLCTLFLALSLRAQIQATRLGRRSLAPAAFALFAMGSKEPGFLAVPLALLAAAAYRPREALAPWLRGLARDVAPVLAAGGVAFAVRTLVLGGMGGPPSAALSKLPLAASFVAVLFPQPYMPRSANALAIALALVVALTSLAGVRRLPRSAAAGRAIVVALGWTALTSALYAYTGQIEPWYLALPLAGVAMGIGVAGSVLWSRLRASSGIARATAAVGLAALAGLVGWQIRYSVLLHDYDEWTRADRELRDCLDDLTPRLAAAAPGTIVRTRPVAAWIRPLAHAPPLQGTAVISDYGLQAWVDLRFPDRKVRVLSSDQIARARADEVTLVPVWKLP